MGVKPAEASFALRNPGLALKARSIANQTLSQVYIAAAAGQIPGGVNGLHNGPADAVRHAAWSCRMAQQLGAETATAVGDSHEDDKDQPAEQKRMDQKNNAVGRGLAGKSGDCLDNAIGAEKAGELQTSPE